MNNKITKVVFGVIAIFIVINNLVFFSNNILSWDVFGYYLYLPLKFIYNDLGLNHFSTIEGILEKYHNTATFYQALKMPDGNFVMKYSMGLSIFYAPFFFIGHFIATIFHYSADGFSVPYQYSIFIGSMLYSIIGIWALTKVLVRFFSDKVVGFILIILVFSTNYLVHITMYGQNAMSHNYLFTTYALIIWLSILWHESYKIKYAIYLSIVCGITILSRPSEIVCLLIPALWDIDKNNFLVHRIALFHKHKKQIFLFTAILIGFGLFQMIYWKIYTGKFIYNSYGGNAGEGFELFSPYILEVLFSFRKGWLIYTPVMFFSIAGFYFMYKKNNVIFYSLFIYFIINIYIVSSWSCWWYAQSFSQRSLVPSYSVMAIGLGYFLTWLNQKSVLKVCGYTLIVVCVCLNIFQTIQFHNGTIDGDRMTKEYYFRVFGKMYSTEEDRKTLLIKRSFDGTETFNNENEYTPRLLKKLDFEDAEKKDSSFSYSGKYSFKLDSITTYSPCIETAYREITNQDHAWIRMTAYIYLTNNTKNTSQFSLVVNFDHNDYAYKYVTFDSEKMKLKLNKWNKISFDYLTPEVRNKNDKLKIYFWQRGSESLFVDDLEAIVYEKDN